MSAMIILLCSWGDKGHQKINGNAPQFFPAKLNHFTGWSEVLAAHSSDADNRKKEDKTEGVKHFIDIDIYDDFTQKHQISEIKAEAFTRYGQGVVMKNGTLPWITDSTYHLLVKQFRSKEWAKAVITAADLGHYVGDGFMPLHLTLNYDGKQSEQTGIHSRYEVTMINRYIDEIPVPYSKPHQVTDVKRYVFGYIYKNYQFKDSLLNADKVSYKRSGLQYNDQYYESLWKETQGFTKKLIAGSSKAFAELVISAWIEAGKPHLPREIDFSQIPQSKIIKRISPVK